MSQLRVNEKQMKKNVIVTGVVLGTLFTYLVGAKSVEAFSLGNLPSINSLIRFFSKGQVRGETMTGQFESSPQGSPSGLPRNHEDNKGQSGENKNGGGRDKTKKTPDTLVNKLVAAGRLTQAQGAELLAKLNAIKAKRDEVAALERDLKTWVKNNSLDLKMAGRDQQDSVGR